MKKLILILTSLAATLGTTLETTTALANGERVSVPTTRQELIKGIDRLRILARSLPSEDGVGVPVLDGSVPADVLGFDSQNLAIDGLDSDLGRTATDLLMEGLTPKELIEDTLQRSHMDQELGPRIMFFEQRALQVIDASKKRGQLNGEVLMRLTLARCVDSVHHVIPTGSHNATALAVVIDGMYEDCFKFAYREALTLQRLRSLAVGGVPTGVGIELHDNEMPQAVFGQEFAAMMIKWARDARISSSARAFLTMRLLGYLGWDLNTDFMRRTFRPAIVRIAQLQNSKLYFDIITVLNAENGEPPTPMIKMLNSEWQIIYDQLPGLLIKAYGNDYYQRQSLMVKGIR